MTMTLTNPVHDVQPQDIAMDDFRKQFRLVAGCKVSKDGKSMTYDFKTMSAAHSELSTANSIIIANKLPLVAGVRSVMKGKEALTIQLIIVYNPPVAKEEPAPGIDLSAINKNFHKAFAGFLALK